MRLEPEVRVRGLVPVFTGTVTVVLLLVFFVLLSTSFMMQPGIAVELPASRFLLPAMQDPLVVSVTGGPGAAVYFEDRAIETGELGGRLEDAPLALVSAVTELALERGFNVALAASRPTPP